ncbi:MAG: DUF1273 domain-containing protein [Alistipes sp.]|nr:DUF1273 domain-containing protein [Alistipes senegalensis]MCM1250191.1 DUF1273 domain-containing protein [Alistipes sp.]
MFSTLSACVAFTGHRSYRGEAYEALRRVVGEAYECGFRTFLGGMAVGFDLAAAEAVSDCRASFPDLRFVAVIPFRGQAGTFSEEDRVRFGRIITAADRTVVLSEHYHRGVYSVRNDFLVDHAARLVAWFDGSPGGTAHTVSRALRFGRQVVNLCPSGPVFPSAPTLFE